MVGAIFWLIVGVGILLVVVAVIVYALVLRRGRAVGTKGVVQRSHLLCPKCGREFDYDWIPGGSLSAVRLGPRRYMACPLCDKWSTFDLYGNLVERPSAPAEPPAPPPTG